MRVRNPIVCGTIIRRQEPELSELLRREQSPEWFRSLVYAVCNPQVYFRNGGL